MATAPSLIAPMLVRKSMKPALKDASGVIVGSQTAYALKESDVVKSSHANEILCMLP